MEFEKITVPYANQQKSGPCLCGRELSGASWPRGPHQFTLRQQQEKIKEYILLFLVWFCFLNQALSSTPKILYISENPANLKLRVGFIFEEMKIGINSHETGASADN